MTLRTLALATTFLTAATAATAGGHLCWEGKTVTEGKLTIATGNPAFFPWVIDDAPESGEGFEAAVAYAVAEEMGVPAEDVVWVRTSFDEAIQPGAKSFDVNMQQYSITEDRDQIVDFSESYYSAPMAVVAVGDATKAEGTVAGMQDLRFGAVGTTTAVPMLMENIEPNRDPLLYNDNADVIAAMQAGQIDAALFDLPTALYLSAVVIDGSSILGQFPADRSENPDNFGMLMEEGSALKECVDAALATLKEDGTLAEIEATWLSETTGVPVIE
ncbi:MAG: ABC transporter substrate-binding protein [Shimia sp.]